MKETGLAITTLSALLVLKAREALGKKTNSCDLTANPLTRLLSLGWVEEYRECKQCIAKKEEERKHAKDAAGQEVHEMLETVRVRLTAEGRARIEQAQMDAEMEGAEAVDAVLRKNGKESDILAELVASRQEANAWRERHQRVLLAYLARKELHSIGDDEAHAQAIARLVALEQDLKPNDLKVLQ